MRQCQERRQRCGCSHIRTEHRDFFPLNGNGLWRDFRCLPRRCPSLSLWARRTGPPGVSGGTIAPSAGPSSGTVTAGCFPWQREPAGRRWADSRPLPQLQAELSFRVTYNEGGFWSLYTQIREPAADGHILLRRWGDTWDLRRGYPVSLPSFFPHRRGWKRRLLTLAAQEIQRKETAGYAGIWTAGEGGCGSSSTPYGFTSPRKVLPSSTPCTPSPRRRRVSLSLPSPTKRWGHTCPFQKQSRPRSAPQT